MKVIKQLTIDLRKFTVTYGGKDVYLSPKEFGLLSALDDADGGCVTRDKLMKNVWGVNVKIDTRTVDQHVARVRNKTAKHVIVTVRSHGYRLSEHV